MKFQSGLNFPAAYGLAALVLAVSVGGFANDATATEHQTFVIGTGKVAGVYYPAAGAICQAMNGVRESGDPTCTVVPGESSNANLAALRAESTDFAIVQSDWQFWAHQGAEFFADPTPFTSLRAVMALHAEPLVLPETPDWFRDSGQLANHASKGGEKFTVLCSTCHGLEGKGNGPTSMGLIDIWENPIIPADLTNEHHKSGDAPTDLYRTIATGLDGTPMVGFAEALSKAEIWNLVAFIKHNEVDGQRVDDRSLTLDAGTTSVYQVGKRKFARVCLT